MQKHFTMALPFFLCLAILIACSGTNQTSTQSSTNISIDMGPVKVKKIKSNKKEFLVPENPKQYIDGEICKFCEFIGRSENENGNLVESAISKGFKNGVEKEYLDGKVIRSSFYVDGGKSGKEYIYSNDSLLDSVYIETKSGFKWDKNEIYKALPPSIARYTFNKYIKDEPLGIYMYTLCNDKIQVILKNDEGNSTFTPIITINYSHCTDNSTFKVTYRKPFHEDMTFKNNELVERNVRNGNEDIYTYKKDEFLKDFYPNGASKRAFTGNVTINLENDSTQCIGSCHWESFYEEGSKEKESFYEDGNLKQEKKWNKEKQLIFDFNFPNYSKTYFNDGTLYEDIQGELARESGKVVCKNGYEKRYYQDGKPSYEAFYEDSIKTKSKSWYNNGQVRQNFLRNKSMQGFFENGQLQSEFLGEVTINNGTFNIVNGTSKNWLPNGTLYKEATLENSEFITFKKWDSTAFLTYDFKKYEYLKTFKKDPASRTEWIGKVVRDSIRCVGDCYQKTFLNNILTIHETREGFDSTSKTFKKITNIKYDLTGKKILDETYKFGELEKSKIWNPQNGSLLIDFKINSHVIIYQENKKKLLEFSGKVTHNGQDFVYIDGASTEYLENGKKGIASIWKNNKKTHEKVWNENGSLLLDVDAEKYVYIYFPNTKKLQYKFEGTSVYQNNDFTPVTGIAQTFDIEGNLIKTENIENGYIKK